jgi:hypothetical protein
MEHDPALPGPPMDPADDDGFAYLVSRDDVSVVNDAKVDDRVS